MSLGSRVYKVQVNLAHARLACAAGAVVLHTSTKNKRAQSVCQKLVFLPPHDHVTCPSDLSVTLLLARLTNITTAC